MGKKMRFHSIKARFLLYAVIFILPIIIFLMSSNIYSISLVRRQVYKSDKNIVRFYMNQLDTIFQNADDYLIDFGMNNINLINILTEDDDLERQLSYYRVYDQFQEKLSQNYSTLDGLFLYSIESGESVIVGNVTEEYDQQIELETYLTRIAAEDFDGRGLLNTKWYLERVGAKNYLFRIYEVQDVYFGAWYGVERCLEHLFTTDIAGLDYIVLADQEGNAYTYEEEIPKDIQLDGDLDHYYLTGENEKYLVVGESSEKGDIRLLTIILDDHILEGLELFKILIFILVLVSIGLGISFLLFSKKEIALPLKKISDAMNEVEHGNLDIQVELERPKTEIAIVNDSFHSMVKEIKQLKIDIYEEKLEKQKQKLEFLQIQIKPHFFLNAMDTIYNYARLNMLEESKEMTLSLVKHFRYTLYGDSMVELEKELEFVKNYLHIQELHSNHQLSLNIQANLPEKMKKIQIPILTIQPFVENSIKNRNFQEWSMTVSISGYLEFEEEGTYLVLLISDTGEGFDEATLRRLNAKEPIIKDGRRSIGIANVRSRLQIIYGSQASIKFFNNQPKGAVVQIRFPEKQIPGDKIC